MLPNVHTIPDVRGKRVIVRTSMDVPIEDGVVVNTFRIEKALPTITYLMGQGARIIILTHVGRDPENVTRPIYDALTKFISLTHVEAVIGDDVSHAVDELSDGDALLLGNLRAHREEEENDPGFAKALASYADYYVNDAFAVSHRAHASIVSIPSFLPSYAGLTFMEEYENLSRALTPEHPALFIIGGAKFETKLPLIERYADTYEQVFVGGALANDLIKAKGYEVGESLLSDIDLKGTSVMEKKNIITPEDVVVGGGRGALVVPIGDVQSDEKILDVGPASVEALAPYIAEAKTILWNGPLGNYEGGFDAATKACAKLIAESEAFSIVGGGDTVTAIESLGLGGQFSYLSTAGGAMLEFLEKGTLPGIQVLEEQ